MRKKSAKIYLPQFPWYGDSTFEIDFPPNWEIIICNMLGHEAQKLNKKGIRAAFSNPIGTARIAELARGKKEVVILFDDLTRPTKAAELVPYILEELREGGIKDEAIRFVAALGAHGAMKLMDFQKKLGKDIVQKFPVYNHNPYENCTHLGTTSRGTPVRMNSEVMSCDLKIAIGGIVPHDTAGFGGGAKIINGVAHIDTIYANHHNVAGRDKPTPENPLGKLHHSVGVGKVEGNAIRLDLEEMARMMGLDVIINAVINLKRETMGLFVGDVVTAHREGVKLAQQIYATESPGKIDVLVANAYAKANEGMAAVQRTYHLQKEDGGDLVLFCNVPEGQICHYLGGSFGKNMGGRLWGPRTTLPPRTKKMITVGPFIDRAGLSCLGPPESIIRVKDWAEALVLLKKTNGAGTRVAVIPDATLQYFPNPGS
jgi:nickel-dependent lactate racemase